MRAGDFLILRSTPPPPLSSRGLLALQPQNYWCSQTAIRSSATLFHCSLPQLLSNEIARSSPTARGGRLLLDTACFDPQI
jgi:hypothetical protein